MRIQEFPLSPSLLFFSTGPDSYFLEFHLLSVTLGIFVFFLIFCECSNKQVCTVVCLMPLAYCGLLRFSYIICTFLARIVKSLLISNIITGMYILRQTNQVTDV